VGFFFHQKRGKKEGEGLTLCLLQKGDAVSGPMRFDTGRCERRLDALGGGGGRKEAFFYTAAEKKTSSNTEENCRTDMKMGGAGANFC